MGDECLKQVRVAQNRSDTVRVVLDLSSAGEDSISVLHDPFRIVIDLHRQKNTKTQLGPILNTSDPRPEEASGRTASKQTAIPDQSAQKVSQPSLHQDVKSVAASSGTIAAKAQRAPLAVTEIGSSTPEAARPAPAPVKTVAAEKRGESTRADFGAKQPPKVAPDMAATPKAAIPTSHGDRTLTRMLGLKISRIVIDPGHGGHDQGTMGPRGLLEKNLVLSLARDLQKLLQEKLGAEVILTRTDDSFVSLEERTAIANRHKADLFISIHANSSRLRSISGVETYFLNFAQTDAEREVAARENATAVNNVRDLEDLIKKIAQADKSVESKELASIIQKKLYSGARRLLPSTQNRGVRSAPFVVLIGANMPSVLVEVAFISNPRDERLLSKEANQSRIAKSLFSGIEGYMKTLGSDVAHNITVQSK